MKKTISFGEIDYMGTGRKTSLVTIDVELRNKGGQPILRNGISTGEVTPVYIEFSACGNIWNTRKTDIYCGGQCLDTIYEHKKELSNLPLFMRIYQWWKEWHLNGMNAGTPEQTAAIKKWQEQGNKYDYTKVCEYLQSIGLYEVEHNGNPYKYGHGWLVREIPADVLESMKEVIA